MIFLAFQFVTFIMKNSGTHQAVVFFLKQNLPSVSGVAALFKLLDDCFFLSLV